MSTTPSTPSASKPAPGPTLSEKIATIGSAWETIAPETKYANMTLAEYKTAVAPFVMGQQAVVLGTQTGAANVVTKNLADAATQLVLNRTVSAIKADPAYGPNSALYRACGYIPSSERASGTRKIVLGPCVADTVPAVPKKSIALIDRLSLITAAWTFLAPETKFSGQTLAEFVTAVAPSHSTRAAMDLQKAAQSGAIGDRNSTAAIARRANQQVVASVIAADGKASAIYHAMGYKNIG